MTRVLLDTMIYDRLALDHAVRRLVRERIASVAITVVVSPIVLFELKDSSFKGIPDFFPVEVIADAVAIAGHAVAGLVRPGEGKVFAAHLGYSKKSKDAIIAETASSDCDVFVSDDNRCRKRLRRIQTSCKVFNYDEFVEWLTKVH